MSSLPPRILSSLSTLAPRRPEVGLGLHRWGLGEGWRQTPTPVEEIGWEMAVRIEKIVASVLKEAHERQVEEVMDNPH